jgi:hypothetical protein
MLGSRGGIPVERRERFPYRTLHGIGKIAQAPLAERRARTCPAVLRRPFAA